MTPPVRQPGRHEGRGWHLRPPRRRLTRAAVIVFALLLAASSIAAGAGGSWLATTFLMVVAFGIATLVLPRDRRRIHPVTHEGGLLLPARPVRTATVVAWGVVGATLTANGGFAVFDAFVLSRWDDMAGSIASIVAGLVILTGVRAAVHSRTAQHRGLLLTPAVIVISTRRPPRAVPWADVVAVHDHWKRREDGVDNWLTFELSSGPRPRSGWSRFARLRRHPSLDPAALAVDPHAVLDLVQYYLDHAAARDELGTDAALERFDALESPELEGLEEPAPAPTDLLAVERVEPGRTG